MKTYVIMLSKQFPVGHPRAGAPTFFCVKFLLAIGCPYCEIEQDLSGENISSCNSCWNATKEPKLHTIRANFPAWQKRIAEVQSGAACLSIRQWSGKPYRSKQLEIARLTASDGIGVQLLDLSGKAFPVVIDGVPHTEPEIVQSIAANDGLSLEDWENWFKCCDKSKPLAIIHFTKFRY